jgi:hypothetical protein
MRPFKLQLHLEDFDGSALEDARALGWTFIGGAALGHHQVALWYVRWFQVPGLAGWC